MVPHRGHLMEREPTGGGVQSVHSLGPRQPRRLNDPIHGHCYVRVRVKLDQFEQAETSGLERQFCFLPSNLSGALDIE